MYSASPETIRRDPGNLISVARSATAGQTDRQHEFGFNCSMGVHGTNGGQNPSRRENANHRRSPPPAFCISCALSVQNRPSQAMRLRRGQRCIAKTSATTGSLQGLSRRSRSPGRYCRKSVADFLHCTNLMELTAQGFTRTVTITLATKMQSPIPEISATKKLKNGFSRNQFEIRITN